VPSSASLFLQRQGGLAKIALTERDELPTDVAVCDFKPCYAWGCALVGSRHATGIQVKHVPASFVSRNMGVPVQDKINVIWQMIGRYMLETEFQSVSRKIDNQWPFVIAVAISSHDSDLRANRPELVENSLRANVAQVPDFISVLGDFSNGFRQTVVGVGQYEDTQVVLRFLRRWHSGESYLYNLLRATRSRCMFRSVR
jgi:hypothetical protein